MRREHLSGQDLKRIRTVIGVPLERIALETNVTTTIRVAVEEDRSACVPPEDHRGSFLTLYAQCLQLAATVIS